MVVSKSVANWFDTANPSEEFQPEEWDSNREWLKSLIRHYWVAGRRKNCDELIPSFINDLRTLLPSMQTKQGNGSFGWRFRRLDSHMRLNR